MTMDRLIDSALLYIFLLIVITFHECGHAWTAWKMGDPTAKMMGRVTLNPIAHIDPIGTVLLPGIALLLGVFNPKLGSLIIGWGRPVPVNPLNFRNRKWGEVLVSLAGPFMNIAVAFVAIALGRIFVQIGVKGLVDACPMLAWLSLFLCYFNLLPIPPLDGSHVFKWLVGMSEESYLMLSRYGIILIILAIQFPPVMQLLDAAVTVTYRILVSIVMVV